MSEPDERAPLDRKLIQALEQLSRAQQLLVAMDFDGVMAPLVDRAEDARAMPGSAAALTALTELPGTAAALISGRDLATLRRLADPGERTLLIGSHGAEVWAGPSGEPLTLSGEARELLEAATAIVQSVVDAHPGTGIETKPAGVVLHTRTAEERVGNHAVDEAGRRLGELDGLFMTNGKKVLETSVVSADKGRGLEKLRELSGATAILFAGDDVTDEHAMAVLGPDDVGIKVGPGESRAGYRVDSPEHVQDLLEAVLRFRTSATTGTA